MARVFLLILLLSNPGSTFAQTSSIFPESIPAPGVNTEILASDETTWEPFETMSLRLERVTADAVDAPFLSNGPELWFAESGDLTITSLTETTSLPAGDSTIVTAEGGLTVSFAGGACPSALRLVLAAAFGMVVESETAGPALPSRGDPACPASEVLIDGTQMPAPTMPAQLVLARLSLEPNAWFHTGQFAGVSGFAIEDGAIVAMTASGSMTGLSKGGWFVAPAGQEMTLEERIGKPVSMLVAAVQPTGPGSARVAPAQTTPAPPDYSSLAFGYSVSWDDTWVLNEVSGDDSSERLVLSNGVSTVYIEYFGNYGEDALTCANGVLNRIATDPANSDIASLDGTPGAPSVDGDRDVASAVMTLHFDDGTTVGDYAEYIECRVVSPGTSVMLITHFSPVDSYATEAEVRRLVLDTIAFDSGM